MTAENKAKIDEKERLKKVADSLAKSRAPGKAGPAPAQGQPRKP